jgi:hypothetical protein
VAQGKAFKAVCFLGGSARGACRALRIKERVDAGKTLTNSDTEHRERSLKNTQQILPLIDRNPEYQSLATKAINLYHHITEKGLENEKINRV